MAKLFIAGHSDSDTVHLPPGVTPWPEMTRSWLEATTGKPYELHSRDFHAMGAKAVSYLLGAIEKVQPDIAIIPLGAYVCTVGLVAESVRVRFGEKAHRLYLSTESSFVEHTSDGRLRRAVNEGGRRATRALLGTRTLTTVAETTRIYEEILHGLARMESLQVLAIADARFSEEIQKREPQLHQNFDAIYAVLRPIVEQHHFQWVDLEAALRRAPDRRIFHGKDGLHTTPAFHQAFFEVLREALSNSVKTP